MLNSDVSVDASPVRKQTDRIQPHPVIPHPTQPSHHDGHRPFAKPDVRQACAYFGPGCIAVP